MGRKRTFNFSKQNSLVDTKKKIKKDTVSVSESKNLNYNQKSLQKNVKEEKNGKNLNKRTKKKHELSCAPKSNTNCIKNIPKIYVQGNMNQSSLIFGIYRGRQCVAVSLLSILFSKLFVVTSWISSTLDRILHIGTELYASIRNSYGGHNDYLLINELPQSLHIDALNTDFNLDISTESQVGLISTNEYVNPDVGMSLYESLQTCYLCYESCFVTFGVNTFSVMRINDRFYVFDSHSRDKHGMMTPDGTSVLIEMNDIMEVNNHCMNLSLSMNLPSNTQFEVTGINVTVSNNINAKCNDCMYNVGGNLNIESELKNTKSDELKQQSDDNQASELRSDNIITNDNVVISHIETNPMIFCPLTLERRNELCHYIGLPTDKTDTLAAEGILHAPKSSKTITGDGNCFFRSLSYSLNLTEEFHHKIRLAVVRHMKNNPLLFRGFLPLEYNSVNDCIQKSKMRKLGTWSTEIELFVSAQLFQCDIYTYSNGRWLKFSPVQIDNNRYKADGIYLNHTNQNHYDVVEDVFNSCYTDCETKTGNANDHIECDNITVRKRITKRKRGSNWSVRKGSNNKRRYIPEKSLEESIFPDFISNKDDERHLNKRKKYVNKKKRFRYINNKPYTKYIANDLSAKYRKYLKKKLKNKYRKQLKEQLMNRYKTELAQKLSVKYRSNSNFRSNRINKIRNKYCQDSHFKHLVKIRVRKSRENKIKDLSEIQNVIAEFRKNVTEGPIYVCCVCNRLLFKNQVKECKEEKYALKCSQVKHIADRCITKTYFHECDVDCMEHCNYSNSYKTLWICHTCDDKILKGTLPSESIINSLNPGPIPSQLSCLNTLESHLVSRNIVFMKLVKVSPQNEKILSGEIVMVPSKLNEVTDILPRSRNEDQLIRIKLKKRLSHKSYQEFQTVTTKNIQNALDYLIENNKFYSDVTINESWINEQNCDDPVKRDNLDAVHESEFKEDNNDTDDEDLEMIDPNVGDNVTDAPNPTFLQSVDPGQDVLNDFDKIFSISPAENNRPVRILMDDTNEACSFPYLFPTGKNVFSEKREKRITLGRYLHCRLMNVDNRFARCTEYLFYAQYIYELQQVLSGISIALRQGRMGDNAITADMLTQKGALENILSSDKGYRFLKNVRGTPAYWQVTQKDMFAMIRQLGKPTFFISLSSAEMRWESTIEIILRQQGDCRKVGDLSWAEKREILKSNPVSVARAFIHRVNMFKKMIMSSAKPIGEVTDMFHRLEVQQRGSLHLHGLIYVKDAPQIDISSDLLVTQFIDKYISCKLPDVKDDPELHEIVSNVQRHSSKHSKSCRKNKKICRFHFPRPPSQRTFICRPLVNSEEILDNENNESVVTNEVEELHNRQDNRLTIDQAKSILEAIWTELNNPDKTYESLSELFNALKLTQEIFEQAHERLTKKTYFVLKRSINDVWINQYNPHLLRAWNANMDLQYVENAYSAVVYIVSYITKAEREMGLLLRASCAEAKKGNLSAKQCMRKISTTYLHSREISAPESAVRVCNLPLKECSRKVQFIPTGKNCIRISLPLKILQSRAKEGILNDDGIFMTSITDRYIARPLDTLFNDMCLATFCSQYRVMSSSENPNVYKEKNPAYKLQNDLGYIIKRTRTKPAIIRYARFSRTKDPENFYLSGLQLFLPYRIDSQLKPSGFETYEEFYKSGSVKLTDEIVTVKSIVDGNRKLYEKDSVNIEEIEETIENCGEFEDAWASICPQLEVDRLETEIFRAENNSNEPEEQPQIPDLLDNKSKNRVTSGPNLICSVSKTEAIPLLKSMNKIQSRVFYSVRQHCLDIVNNKKPNPLRLFCTGPGGVGKSLLIKCIYYEASRILSKTVQNLDQITVLLCAPTGVAAFQINAQTIHSTFSIRKKFKFPPYQPLGEETINTLRAKYCKLQILIIDEISMVDHKLLGCIHGRLRQIKGTNMDDLFGNVSVICFGDMYQLKPVKGKSLCYDNVIDLWNGNFKIVELTQIMRQRHDLAFAETLNRIRQRKKGDNMLKSDIELLESRVTGEENDSLHIFATNAQVDNYNQIMLGEHCPDFISIPALDYSKDVKTGQMKLKETCVSSADTPLVPLLKIAINCRVMLVVNLDVTAGLINGSFGTVTYIQNNENDKPVKIYVKFDNDQIASNIDTPNLPAGISPNSFPIEIHEASHINFKGDIRRQFPLKLCYAVTVHKVQGLSLDKAVISLEKIFAPGQAYVALSRVKTLEGLTIQHFDEKLIYCDEKVEDAMANIEPLFQHVDEVVSPTSTVIILHNIQGLIPHIENLKNDERMLNADFICLTETWLNNITNPEKIRIDNFIFHNQTRNDSYDDSDEFKTLTEKEHGGVGLYNRRDKAYNILRLGVINIEHLAFNIPDKNINVIIIYRPPTYALELFLRQLNQLLIQLEESSFSYIIMGDFNQNLLEGSNSIEKCFNDCWYKQCVKSFTTEGGTLIDHVYISRQIKSSDIIVAICPTYYSYHEAIKIVIQ